MNARAAGGGHAASERERRGFDQLTIDLPSRLDFGETQADPVSYDLPAAGPRSTSDVRVGEAFATSPGRSATGAGPHRDPGRLRHRHLRQRGGRAARRCADRVERGGRRDRPVSPGHRRRGRPHRRAADPARRGCGDGPGLARGRRLADAVSDLLRRGLPALRQRIGLPWPVDGELAVSEVHTPLLEGYGGFYDASDDEIVISEDLDDLTIIHEAAHAWFNAELFDERWINEGLADEYAARTLAQLELHGGAVEPRWCATTRRRSRWPSGRRPRRRRRSLVRPGNLRLRAASRAVIAEPVIGDVGWLLSSQRRAADPYAGEARRMLTGPPDWRRFLDPARAARRTRTTCSPSGSWSRPIRPFGRARLSARVYGALLDAGDGWATADGRPTRSIASGRSRWHGRRATDRRSRAGLGMRSSPMPRRPGWPSRSGWRRRTEGATGKRDLGPDAGRRSGSAPRRRQCGVMPSPPSAPLMALGTVGRDTGCGLCGVRDQAFRVGDLAAARPRQRRHVRLSCLHRPSARSGRCSPRLVGRCSAARRRAPRRGRNGIGGAPGSSTLPGHAARGRGDAPGGPRRRRTIVEAEPGP